MYLSDILLWLTQAASHWRATPDFFNGLYEFFGGWFILQDVRKLLEHKTVKGVFWPGRAYFMTWGMWNLYYYPSFNQWWSFTGGLVIVAANTVWVALACYYTWRNKYARN